MSKHTPGPWCAKPRDLVNADIRPPNAVFHYVEGAGAYEFVADCSVLAACPNGSAYVQPDNFGEANARLIAATPDMLQALRDIAALTTNEGTELESLLSEIQGICAKAITKVQS